MTEEVVRKLVDYIGAATTLMGVATLVSACDVASDDVDEINDILQKLQAEALKLRKDLLGEVDANN